MSVSAPTKALLSVQNITRSYGSQPVLNQVSLTIHDGDRIGLIGRNGSGKSTLMRILAGMDTPDSGLVTQAQNLSVVLLAQECSLDRTLTIGQVLLDATERYTTMVSRYHEILETLHDVPPGREHDRLHDELEHMQHTLDIAGGWDTSHEIRRIATSLNLPEFDRVLSTLSGGELRRVDLASKLLLHPDVLMLDEPTNHIDTRSVEWIENFLERYEGSSILVTHDRYFLDRAVNRIVELEHTGLYSFPGSYSKFLEYKAQVEDTQIRAEDNRQSLLRRELEWMRRGPKARSTKQQARINRFHEVEEQGPPPRHREFEFEIPEPLPLGKTILNANSITFKYGPKVLFKDFTLIMQKGMRVGILGPNGAGKTTMLRVLMGQERPCKGQVVVGDATQFLYLDQSHADVNPDQNILEFVSDGARFWEIAGRRIYIPAYLEKFLFDKNSVLQPIGNLSGGERNRLDLVRKLLRGGNFLVLDEPTNDLDLYTLRILEETIVNFGGCALVVSHDRYFLNRICTHMIVLEGDGKVTPITGNYDDYLLYRARQEEKKPEPPKAVAPPADVPKEKTVKLTYQEKRELEAMEARILAEEGVVAGMEQSISAPGFYQQDRAAIQEALTALENARKTVAASYHRWEELSAKG